MENTFSREPKNQSADDLTQFQQMSDLFVHSHGTLVEKIDAFPKFATRQSLAKFLTKYEIFKQVLDVNGSIIEGGVLHGGGTLTWAKLSSILEPINHTRKVIGFDTFSGFPSVGDEDLKGGTSSHFHVGGLTGSPKEDVEKAIKLYDLNRPLKHIPKVELVEGDACLTAQQYLKDNPHLVVSVLYLDVDLFEPTKALIQAFLPRMPKGSIIAFDELNAKMFPGETVAVADAIGINNLHIKRFPFDSYVSYAVL
ncbi:hypothetical protein KBY83_03315 [Cyanobium sp. WKJ7-Wakatipu]|uniref:TylF/MycF family methyltransferase n=1 Tax=Cyanobium sp. WKJ7-Wakatipu TaxID=2823726 RepID=UPI0020CE2862|nr:TylF/MycF family methyltransferase [Cyanobium sp. WKJ7-Wakatipu]MCP9782352.1 hypothetical protein [Cyanobium sp. WKJ7-Wakatipu]